MRFDAVRHLFKPGDVLLCGVEVLVHRCLSSENFSNAALSSEKNEKYRRGIQWEGERGKRRDRKHLESIAVSRSAGYRIAQCF